jgi:hypothetical protein
MTETEEGRSRFLGAIAAFSAANAADPNTARDGDSERPRELLDAERLAAWVERLEPNASEALRLAARCQHLRRWEVRRSDYETGRIGYLKWRKALARFHADRAAEVLRAVGYDAGTLERVRRINMKQDITEDRDVQTMEDALCLSFLEYELEEFAAKHPEEKTVDILFKTWNKMSARGRDAALALQLSGRGAALLEKALAGAGGAESAGDA